MADSNGRPPSADSDVLQQRRAEFVRSVTWGERLLARIERDGNEVTHVRRGPNDWLWFLRVHLPPHIQERFGTAPEVLLIAVRGQVQGRDMERARSELYSAGFRLDLDLLVVVDELPDLESRLRRLPGQWGQWIPWPFDSEVRLQEQLRTYLRTFDVFDEKDPVRGRQVFGRADEISEIVSRIEASDSVGVFGLRKVGKTTVVRAVSDTLDPVSARLSFRAESTKKEAQAARVRVAWLDVQRVYDRSGERFLSMLADAISRRFAAESILPPRHPRNSLERIEVLLGLLHSTDKPLCVVLDEYDYLFEGEGGERAIPGVPELLRMLRGWAQETRRLAIVVIGRDPRFFHRTHLGGFPNPMLGWFSSRWLGPLQKDRATELLRKLGRRVRLDVGYRTSQVALQWTGGHPLLQRQFGSALLEMATERDLVPTDGICDEVVPSFCQRSTVRDVCNEILQLLWSHYRESHDLIVDLSRTKAAAVTLALHGGFGEHAASTAKNFGLLAGTEQEPIIPEVIREYARCFEPPPPAVEVAAPTSVPLTRPPPPRSSPSGESPGRGPRRRRRGRHGKGKP